MNSDIITIILKFILSSGVMFVFYMLLFRGKASYNHCRLFLLTTPVICLIISMLSLEVLPAKSSESIVQTIENSINTVPATVSTPEPQLQNEQLRPQTAVYAQTADNTSSEIDSSHILIALYIAIAVILAASTMWQLHKIARIRRRSEHEHIGDITIFHSHHIETPFSVMKEIYLNDEYKDEKQYIIISHEHQHILHRHYIDNMLSQVMVIVFWFNPFVWLIRRELLYIHEFQVDQSIINEGIDIDIYLRTIFEEVVGTAPNIANGFNGSLIKKRFITMKNGNKIKLKRLRGALIVPFIAIMLALFSFTESKEKKVTEQSANKKVSVAQKNANQKVASSETQVVTVKFTEGDIKQKVEKEVVEPVTKMQSEIAKIENMVKVTASSKKHLEEQTEVKITLKADTVITVQVADNLPDMVKEWQRKYNALIVPKDQIELINLNQPRKVVIKDNSKYARSKIVSIERKEGETLITMYAHIYWDWNWLFWDKRTKLVDPKSGDAYMIRSVKAPFELGRMMAVNGLQGNNILYTLVFPPLGKDVKVIDFVEPENKVDIPTERNNTGEIIPDIVISNYTNKPSKGRVIH